MESLGKRKSIMPEIVFDCPACKQAVQADDAWAGQEIQCPLCHSPMIVPGPAPAAQPHYTGKGKVDVPKETRLSAGATQVARSTTGGGPAIRNFQAPKTKKQNPIVKYAAPVVVVAALGIGGWFGWPYLKPHLPFLNKGGEAAAGNAATAGKGGDATSAAQPATPPPPKEVPMTPPVYTLDVSQAKFTEGKVNGSITGTNFVPDAVRLEKLAGAYMLDFRQGTNASPDRGLRVYLRLSGTNTPGGQNWTISPETKGSPVSQVVKVWKTDPKYAAQQKAFATGFALKLELGQMTESNTISGKIYAALPDKEQSVVAGVFHATTATATASGIAPQPVQTPAVQMSPEYQRRYGTPPTAPKP